MDKLWDIVIVGGGLGGLSLAAELAAPAFAHLSVLVLDKRLAYCRDRTWSYWTEHKHRYSHLERTRWSQWSVALGDQTHVHNSNQYAYATVDADAFYRDALAAVECAPHVQIQLGCEVQTISADHVVTAQGKINARTVLDARPSMQHAPGDLVQQFTGWEVRTERDVFTPNCVQLMAFEPHPQGLHFWYVLPYSTRCALVESTWVSPAQWQPSYESELQDYLAHLCQGTDYEIDYREHGVLGLQSTASKESSVIGLGRQGGTLRPSTGYAFIDTVSHAAQLAHSLAAHASANHNAWHPKAYHRPKAEAWMDSVFLDVLRQDWVAAPSYFMRLFERMTPDDTVAFLTGQCSWAQRLRMMRALPVRPFASAALARAWA